MRYALLGLLWLIHLFFFDSAIHSDRMRSMYPQGEIQEDKILDYAQLPNGARTLFEGGLTVGTLERPFPTLLNAYHPTLITVFSLGPDKRAGTRDDIGLDNIGFGYSFWRDLVFLLEEPNR